MQKKTLLIFLEFMVFMDPESELAIIRNTSRLPK